MQREPLLLAFLRRCSAAFASVDDYPLADRVLQPLFKTKPRNSDAAHVLEKVVALNTLYRTGILDIYRMSSFIHRRGRELDRCLRNGDARAIATIRKGHGIRRRGHKEIDFYSFATKYCHWHRPDEFPMYDWYVDVALTAILRSVGDRHKPREVDLRDFRAFRSLVDAAKMKVGWRGRGYKEFDQGLWIMGQALEDEVGTRVLAVIRPIPRGLRNPR